MKSELAHEIALENNEEITHNKVKMKMLLKQREVNGNKNLSQIFYCRILFNEHATSVMRTQNCHLVQSSNQHSFQP